MMAASVSGLLYTGNVDQATKLFRSLAVIVAEQGFLSVLKKLGVSSREAAVEFGLQHPALWAETGL
ncbi:hypothetical protein C5B85_13065 [Pseudoclavibacter sp. AY1F1]|uniref:hypothetical protein n=1 Tax=Pseudoclavibacter sp. AY1F1 TaxID=2080583 RepID=UPI000CE8217B|nr:hypothetical protein [Pseudoclavibacter sp. AY1F1]PPF43620.1 hypothetical protein C5B85_13065 [Pseudoclavibacter sp. AY1F1]